MSFGLYLHWPWCESKCPYCDFNSHIGNPFADARWSDAFAREIRRMVAACPDEVLDTIFIGGGTPSLMAPEIVSTMIDTARSAWRCSNSLEITLEANPGSVEVGRFRAYRQAGVNRVSLGIQALHDADLQRLGRKHSRADALAAIGTAMSTFDRVSLDLMYGRQFQSPADWKEELALALSLGTEHLSLYHLTIEDGTVFGRRHAAGLLHGLPDEDRSVHLFETTQEQTERAGLRAYEVSNHARPGAESRHNLIYWRSGRWVGIGPGAHGRIRSGSTRLATEAHRDPATWMKAVEETGSGDSVVTPLSRAETVEEILLMGLRLQEGIALDQLCNAGLDLARWPSRDRLIESGHAEQSDYLRVTASGRLLLNTVLSELCSDLPLGSEAGPG